MDAGFKSLAGGDTSSAQTYNNLLQLARKETERLEKERLKALNDLEVKEQLLARVQLRKCSM